LQKQQGMARYAHEQEINRLLGRRGTLWQKESFDHIVRSAESMERIRQYIRDNDRRSGVPPR
jgi:putative transposase